MSDHSRVDPFAGDLDLSDFQPVPPNKPAARKEIREVSEANNFPSRAPERTKIVKPQQRRRRTGRNVQFNIKATADTVVRFTALADQRGVAFGELLDQLLNLADPNA